ncbi:MAG: prephenate dehydratase [Candidatus Lokiarchaeota archaeon]|nr:prephenate dehydratase [Candidatus Lokiarchaeota archaeon]MBD3202345.1 prephenate dehydratase [Candidatus Lokiarchaeota archaeon]
MKTEEHLSRELDTLRNRIDSVDKKIIKLIEERCEIVLKIGNIKKNLNLDVYQPHREIKVIDQLSNIADNLDKENIKAIWTEIMSVSKRLQGSIEKIGYLGPEGTFTHQAALEFFPKSSSDLIACRSIIEIFEEIEKNQLDFGVIPIENSLQGTVRETLDLLIEKDIKIYGELELRIHQNLISIPTANLSTINRIYSHPQAFAQARSWIKMNLPHAKLINMNSTADAVKHVANSKSIEEAALGTKHSSELNKLNIISANIEDNPSNYTRFLIISKKENPIQEGKNKTSIVYVTKHKPGALYNVLQLFAEANINLLKIESRPRRKGRWEYIFLMDFQGKYDDINVQEVLDKMEENVIWYKLLGSYPFSNEL